MSTVFLQVYMIVYSTQMSAACLHTSIYVYMYTMYAWGFIVRDISLGYLSFRLWDQVNDMFIYCTLAMNKVPNNGYEYISN